MAADTSSASMASLSSAQLAERLEKSEAGRKKLRQAISILQEKLDAMDKVLKINDKLQKECEQERQRAESEKKKAEEEKKLKSLLERDSATFKDQLAKVLQRLGAVESKQKSDKKEIERLRNEVRLSVEGMRVASEAVTAVQSSFQTLETSLLPKVNAAFEEALAATQAVKNVQGSLQILEQAAVNKQGSSPNIEPGRLLTGRVLEKLVDDISRLFHKERQSQHKIEHHLSMLKSILKVGRRPHALSSAENIIDLERLVSSKKKIGKASKKRKYQGQEDNFDRKVRKREEFTDLAAVNSAVNRFASFEHNRDESGVSHRRSNKVSTEQEENPERGFSASRNITANVSIDISEFDDVNKATNLDSEVDLSDDSEEWFWSNDRVLLSPSLPEIPSPQHSPILSRQPSLNRGDSSVTQKTLANDVPVFLEATKLQEDVIEHNPWLTEASNIQLHIDMTRSSSVHDSTLEPDSLLLLNKQQSSSPIRRSRTEFAMNTTKCGGNALVQGVQSNQNANVNLPEIGTDVECLLAHDNDKVSHKAHPGSDPVYTDNKIVHDSHETCAGSDPVSLSMLRHTSNVVLDNQELTRFEDYTLDAVDDVSFAEISNFLDVLPPMPDALPSGLCVSDTPLIASKEPICSSACQYDEVCTSSQPQYDMQLLKAIDRGHDEATAERLPDCRNAGHAFLENLSGYNALSTLPLTKPSSPCKGSSSCKVFLLKTFELQETDAEVNLLAACILVKSLESHLLHTGADKGEVELQATNLYKTSSDLPLIYVACSIISSAVGFVRSKNEAAEQSTDVKPIHAMLQASVALIRSMFKEKASMMLNTVLCQLSRFLVQGEATLVTLYGLISPCDDPLSVARVICDKKQFAYEHYEATLEDVYTGGKVLAELCQVLACVTHLQNIVYEILGWCDKDIMWLLTIFSSFSSICGHAAFMVEADDLLGNAICAIIVELVASVEQELGKRAESKISEAIPLSPDVSPNISIRLAVLKEVVMANSGNFSVEEVFLEVVGTLQRILPSAHDSLLLSSWRKDVLAGKVGEEVDNRHTMIYECSEFSGKRVMDKCCTHQEVPIPPKILPDSLFKKQRHYSLESLGPQKWQLKYVEAVGALQLIASFMGWEWTYNHMIVRCLWKLVASGSTQIRVAGVSLILSILARIAVKGGGVDLPGLADLKQCVIEVNQSASKLMGKTESIVLL